MHEKTRKPGKAPAPAHVVARLIERTLGDPPGETTHWTSPLIILFKGDFYAFTHCHFYIIATVT